MCLILKTDEQKTIKRAEEDIICYKLVETHKTLHENYFSSDISRDFKLQYPHIEYFSMYRLFPYELGVEYSSSLIIEDSLGFDNVSGVHYGIHTFKDYNNSIEYAEEENAVLIKCRIPKGSMYYEGTFGSDISYASDTLILDKVVG